MAAPSGNIANGNIADADLTADLRRTYGDGIMGTLLMDQTTKKNIIWADDEYTNLDRGVLPKNRGYQPNDQITLAKINGHVIEPRVVKDADRQAWRTKQKAEVFTPSWLCEAMNDRLDAAFLGIDPEPFTTAETAQITSAARTTQTAQSGARPRRRGHPRKAHSARMKDLFKALTRDNRWKIYINSRLLEITYGEAPFICSPYDTTTGERIPVRERIGFLDRKLQVVTHFATDQDDWLAWATRAVQATYGYEYQGDNLLIARINVFNTVADHLREYNGQALSPADAHLLARVISYNIWQMDGLTGYPPAEKDFFDTSKAVQFSLGLPGDDMDAKLSAASNKAAPCKIIFNWQTSSPENKVLKYNDLKKGTSMKKFYGVIGNPPYQEEAHGDQKTFQKPTYPDFMDAAYAVGEKVELIMPDSTSLPHK